MKIKTTILCFFNLTESSENLVLSCVSLIQRKVQKINRIPNSDMRMEINLVELLNIY